MKRQYDLMEALFLKAADDHGNMRNREKRLAVTFLGMINSYVGLSINDAYALNEDLVFSASHQFMHGFILKFFNRDIPIGILEGYDDQQGKMV